MDILGPCVCPASSMTKLTGWQEVAGRGGFQGSSWASARLPPPGPPPLHPHPPNQGAPRNSPPTPVLQQGGLVAQRRQAVIFFFFFSRKLIPSRGREVEGRVSGGNPILQLLWVLRSGRYSCQSSEGTGSGRGSSGTSGTRQTQALDGQRRTVDSHPLCNNEKGFRRFEGQPKVGLT